MLLQRAIEVINIEQIFPSIKRRNYISLLNKNPYKDSKYTEKLERMDPSDDQNADLRRCLNRIEEELKVLSNKISDSNLQQIRMKVIIF
jgi:hypothetical protein